jgi:hypothetical protein
MYLEITEKASALSFLARSPFPGLVLPDLPYNFFPALSAILMTSVSSVLFLFPPLWQNFAR